MRWFQETDLQLASLQMAGFIDSTMSGLLFWIYFKPLRSDIEDIFLTFFFPLWKNMLIGLLFSNQTHNFKHISQFYFCETWHNVSMIRATRAFAWVSDSCNSPSLPRMCEEQCSCTGLMQISISLKCLILYKILGKEICTIVLQR